MNIMGVTKGFLIGLGLCPPEETTCYQHGSELLAGVLSEPTGEPQTFISLKGHRIKLLLKCRYPQISAALGMY